MPKIPKKDQTDAPPSAGETNATSSTVTTRPKNRTKSAKTAAGKSPAKKSGAKTTAAPRSPKKKKPYEPSDADVRLRAYFIAERRVQLALQGDPAEDWLEARQQLLAEAAQRSS